jgi:hypothetical protein
MGDQHPIHISIYIKNESPKAEDNQYIIGYEVEDNDPCLIFTPVMFLEALSSFAKDHDLIYETTVSQLRQRLETFMMSTVVPSHIQAKRDNKIY